MQPNYAHILTKILTKNPFN